MVESIFQILIRKYHDGTGDQVMSSMAREWTKKHSFAAHIGILDKIAEDAVTDEEIGVFNHYRHISLEAWQ